MKVISGGQTGVDQAALRAARACGIETGGTAPKGWLTEDGPAPWLAEYGLVEHESSDYPPRTEANIRDAEATLLLGKITSKGAKLALRLARQLKRPLLAAPLPFRGGIAIYYPVGIPEIVNGCNAGTIAEWLASLDVETLNVAGNRESSIPGIGWTAQAFLAEVFRAWKEQVK